MAKSNIVYNVQELKAKLCAKNVWCLIHYLIINVLDVNSLVKHAIVWEYVKLVFGHIHKHQMILENVTDVDKIPVTNVQKQIIIFV